MTFTPSAAGPLTGTLTTADNSSNNPASYQLVNLTGTGGTTMPWASLSPLSLVFAAQNLNTTSASQRVTLSNTGGAPLTLASIVSSGSNFAQTNNCGVSLAVGSSCTINVTFSPTAGGTFTGTLTVTDNSNGVAGSTQSVALSGTGPDFTLAAASGSSTSATVAPGQSANYLLSVGGYGGMTGMVTFTCTGTPSEATCMVSPNPATLGSSATNATVSVTYHRRFAWGATVSYLATGSISIVKAQESVNACPGSRGDNMGHFAPESNRCRLAAVHPRPADRGIVAESGACRMRWWRERRWGRWQPPI